MVRCSVLGCKNDSEKKLPDISFHSFPENGDLRQKWLEATGRTNWTAKKSSKICSRHFKQHELIKKKKITLLFPNAVPSQQIQNSGIGNVIFDPLQSIKQEETNIEIHSDEAFTTSIKQEETNIDFHSEELFTTSIKQEETNIEIHSEESLTTSIKQEETDIEIHSDEPFTTSFIGLIPPPVNINESSPSTSYATNISTKPDAADNIMPPSMSVHKHVIIEPDVELPTLSVRRSANVNQPTVGDGPDYTLRTLKRKWKRAEEKATVRLKKLRALREINRRLTKKVADLENIISELVRSLS